MGKNYQGRITALKSRRQGTIKRKQFEKSAALGNGTLDSLNEANLFIEEGYQKRSASTALTYAFGAMDEVDAVYTRVSNEQADRVMSQLMSGLSSEGERTDLRLQGSLPLNVHIRRASDVDILVLPMDFLTYNTDGCKAHTYIPSSKDKAEVILALRSTCKKLMKNAYPAATVNDNKGKCITISGGSLRRDIDVVPSLWYDSINYQSSGIEVDRGVEIYDRFDRLFNTNYPFLVRHKINYKDLQTDGACKKAIRLLKTLRTDSDNEIGLSSFDIMSLVYNMDDQKLLHPHFMEGILLTNLSEYLKYLVVNKSILLGLKTVDGTRHIVDMEEGIKHVAALSNELNNLINDITEELAPYNPMYKDVLIKQAFPA